MRMRLPTKMADKQYDVSPKDMKFLQEKAKQRALMRQEYIKQITNPHRHATGEGGTLFDAGVQRFMAMKVSNFEHFKPTPKTAGYGLGLSIIPIVLYTWWLKSIRDKQEHKYRTGQVSYADRKFKFI